MVKFSGSLDHLKFRVSGLVELVPDFLTGDPNEFALVEKLFQFSPSESHAGRCQSAKFTEANEFVFCRPSAMKWNNVPPPIPWPVPLFVVTSLMILAANSVDSYSELDA